MREKSTTVFESSSTTDQSPALKPSFTKHRKGKRITWWHLMVSPILMRGSWWTHTYPFWGFILKKSMYRTNFTAWFFKRITLKNGDAIASSHLSLLLSILNLITSKRWHNETSQGPIPFPSSFAAKMTTSSWKISLKARNVAVHCFHEELGRMSCSQGLVAR